MVDAGEISPRETMPADDCLFCRIVSGGVPADVVNQTARTLAFRDIEPQAPLHVLVISRDHYADIAEMVDGDPGLVGELLSQAVVVAHEQGFTDYRIVLNTGPDAGQSVHHVHAHLLAGRKLRWPPG